MGSEIIQNNSIFLRTPKDWEAWFVIFTAKAEGKRLWRYCDPDAPETDSSRPEPPASPSEEEAVNMWRISHPGETPTELQKQQALSSLQGEYRERKREFEMADTAYANLNEWILSTIPKSDLVEIGKLKTIRQRIIELRRKNMSTSPFDAVIIQGEWDSLNYPKSAAESTEKWVQKWEEAYKRMLLHNKEVVKHPKAAVKFIIAMGRVDPEFAASAKCNLMQFRQEPDKIMTFEELIYNWRDLGRYKTTWEPTTTETVMTTAEFNGKSSSNSQKQTEADSKPKKAKPECLCGLKHYYKECYYINPSIRPTLLWAAEP